MKNMIVICIFLLGIIEADGLLAQNNTNLDRYQNVDHVISDLYHVISGPAGERDWDQMRLLFHPKAIMGALVLGKDSALTYMHFSVEEYIKRNAPYFMQNGFYETEFERKILKYGELIHVFSAYESRHTQDGPVFMRGINSIQLIYEKERWWIVSIQWNNERSDLPIPKGLHSDK